MRSQPFNIEQTLRLGNKYGESILDHIQELSDSLYQILEIPPTESYLSFGDFSTSARAMGEAQFMSIADKLYLPFSIHLMEAYRKRINGEWEIKMEDHYKIPSIVKDSRLYLSNDIFESYKNNFKNEVRSIAL